MGEKVEYVVSLRDLVSKRLEEISGNADRFEARMARMESGMKKVGIAIAAAFAVDKIRDFAMGMVDAGAKVENARTGLTTLLGDAAAAGEVITNTMEDAKKSPFAFEGLLQANKALIAAGVNAGQARTDVMNLANAIAATGGGDDELGRMVVNMQQIKNTGKATALDIKQFAYAGVNIYKVLAEATGKPIEKVKEMEVSYDLLTMALAKAHAAGGIYAGGLENMQNNASVQISNVGDALFQLKVKMFDDLRPAVDAVVSGLGNFVAMLSSAWDWAVRNAEAIGFVASVVAGAAIGYGVYTLYTSGATIATAAWTAAQWLLNVALTANPIGLVITAIGALVAGVIYAWKKFVGFRAVVMGVWGTLKEFGSIVTDVFTGLWKTIKGVFTLDPKLIQEGATQAVGAMYNAGQRMGKAYKDGYEGVMADAKKEDEKGVTSAIAPAGGKVKPVTPPTKTETGGSADKSTSKAVPNKAVTITINIGKLIEKFSISTTNMQESSGKVQELVAKALLSAVNDSQIVSGI